LSESNLRSPTKRIEHNSCVEIGNTRKTSGTNVGYQVCPKVSDVFVQSSFMVACLNLKSPMLPVPEVLAFTSVFPKKSPSMFPEILALKTSGPLNPPQF
jgi:hypothetical protein